MDGSSQKKQTKSGNLRMKRRRLVINSETIKVGSGNPILIVRKHLWNHEVGIGNP